MPTTPTAAKARRDDMAGVRFSFSDARTAREFVRKVRRDLAGSGFWGNDRWILEAERTADSMAITQRNGATRAAEIISATRKGKGVRVLGHRCCKCGKSLWAPESVLAGMGPECQAREAA